MTSTSKRFCRKCGSSIPAVFRFNGKVKSLQNRKFCLTCSPYKGHNTSKLDPVARQRCTPKYKEIVTLSLYKRGLERKVRLIEMSGGVCQRCPYNRSRRALTFHHRDPNTKCFGLSLNHLWSKTWEAIVEEWKKCDMLCMNCHAEVEDTLKGDGIIARVNNKYGTNF